MIKSIIKKALCTFFFVSHSASHIPTVFIYSHGLFDNHTQAYWFSREDSHSVPKKRYIMDGQIVTFDYEDATQWFWRADFTQISMAQTNEIMRLKAVFDHVQDANAGDVVLVGVSRGASVIVNFMGLFNPPQVKALVLEAPFDSSSTIAKSMVKNLNLSWIPGMHAMSHSLLSLLFVQHKVDGIQPVDSADSIKSDLPIFIACSLTDWVVPAASTIALYKKLIETGHTHVYLYIAPKSTHSKIIFSEHADQYTQAVHAFFEKYDLPHNPALAQEGHALLAQCQPDISSLQKYLK